MIYFVARTYDSFGLDLGQVTAVMLYVRTLMNNSGSITNNIQAVAKVFGASYEIAVLIVSPNKVHHDGKSQPSQGDDQTNETQV